jgi:hypothetical protein
MLEYFADDADTTTVMIDATFVRAHPSAAAKVGIKRRKDSGAARVASPAKSMLSWTHSVSLRGSF